MAANGEKDLAFLKVGPKGQILIPKTVRDMFGIEPGDSLLMLADKDRGICIMPGSFADELFEKNMITDRGSFVKKLSEKRKS